MLLEIDKVHKSLNYESNVSQMERPLVNILKNGEVEVKHQRWAVFFIWSTECVEETNFWAIYNNLVK